MVAASRFVIRRWLVKTTSSRTARGSFKNNRIVSFTLVQIVARRHAHGFHVGLQMVHCWIILLFARIVQRPIRRRGNGRQRFLPGNPCPLITHNNILDLLTRNPIQHPGFSFTTDASDTNIS